MLGLESFNRLDRFRRGLVSPVVFVRGVWLGARSILGYTRGK